MKNKTNSRKTKYLLINSDECQHIVLDSIEAVEEELQRMAQDFDGYRDFKGYAENYLEVFEITRTLKINVPTKSITVE